MIKLFLPGKKKTRNNLVLRRTDPISARFLISCRFVSEEEEKNVFSRVRRTRENCHSREVLEKLELWKCSSTGVRIDFWDRELEALSNAILWYLDGFHSLSTILCLRGKKKMD